MINIQIIKLIKSIFSNKKKMLLLFLVLLVVFILKQIYLNTFKCILNEKKDNLYEKNIELWHEKRRNQILEKYPQIKKLEIQDSWLGIFDTIKLYILIIIKFYIIYKLVYVWKFKLIYKVLIIFMILPIFSIIIAQYNHEYGHNTVFKNQNNNKLCLLITDVIYYFGTAFSTYAYMHEFHHDVNYSNTEKDITAIPYNCEESIIKNKWHYKILYQLCHPYRNSLLYEKIFKKPVKLPLFLKLISYIKIILMILFIPEFLIIHYFTELIQFYHPMYPSISEHIQLKPGHMTNSYYGILNKITHNLYYHTEHHDFKKINSRYHPQLRKIAPEFYPELIKNKIILFYKILLSPNYTLTRKLN